MRTPQYMSVSPYSSAKPLPPWVWMAWSTQWMAASAAAYFAMFDGSPAGGAAAASAGALFGISRARASAPLGWGGGGGEARGGPLGGALPTLRPPGASLAVCA